MKNLPNQSTEPMGDRADGLRVTKPRDDSSIHFERAHVEHELHFIDASDAACKRQLRERSRHLPPGTPWTTDAEFETVTVYFQPSEDDGFNVVRHERLTRAASSQCGGSGQP